MASRMMSRRRVQIAILGMARNSRLNTVLVTLAALVAILVVASAPAQAQVKPFKVTGGGIASEGFPTDVNDPRPHWAVGHATELGNYFGEGFFQIDSFTTGAFSSAVPFVFTAANKDDLAFDYAGFVELFYVGNGEFVAVFVATFTPAFDQCTGRFTKVTGGSFVMTAVTDPFVLGASDPVGYTWSGEGSIVFKQGK
jgi:hypothetical protein